MYSLLTILEATAVFIALIVILAGNSGLSKRISGVFMVYAVVVGLVFYGIGYARLLPDNPGVAFARTVFSVCGLFVGRCDIGNIDATPMMQVGALKFMLWTAQICGLYATASAAITAVGAEALKRLRLLMARRGELSVIYGVNDNSVSIGQQIMSRKGNSVVFVGKNVTAASIVTITATKAVLRTDASALSCDEAFLKSVGISPGPRKLCLYALDRNLANNLAYTNKLLNSLEKAGLKPEQTSLVIRGSESLLGAKFQARADRYGFGSVEVFNDASIAARMLIRRYPPYETLKFDKDGRALEDLDVLIVGFGRVGQAVLAELVKNGQFEGSCFHAAIFEKDADSTGGYLSTYYHELAENYDISLHCGDTRSKAMHSYFLSHHRTLKYVVICCGSDKENEDVERDIARLMRLLRCGAQIYQCTYTGLRHSDPATLNVEMLDVFRLELVSDKKLDGRAMALNHMYCADTDTTAQEDWARCDYFSRMSSRASADFIPAMLYAVGKTEAEVRRDGLGLTPEQRENLGRTEHLRWCAFHYVMGYKPMSRESFERRAERYMKEKRETGKSSVRIGKNTETKEHACLVPWEELDELSARENAVTGGNVDYKELDINNVLAIETLLKSAD